MPRADVRVTSVPAQDSRTEESEACVRKSKESPGVRWREGA